MIATLFQWLSIIIAFFDMLTKAADAISAWADARAAKRAGDAIDESEKTGDQTPIEEAIGSPNAGKPTKHEIPELKTRPVGDHTPRG